MSNDIWIMIWIFRHETKDHPGLIFYNTAPRPFGKKFTLTMTSIQRSTPMDFSKINFIAVLVSALSTFVLGGLWYSPLLFGKAWMRVNNFSETDVATFSKARMF